MIKSIRSFNPQVDSAVFVLGIKSREALIFQPWRSFVYDRKDKLRNRLLKELLESFVNKRLLAPLLAVHTNEEW